MIRHDIETLPPFYRRYVEQVMDLELEGALQRSLVETLQTIHSIPEEKGEYRYKPEKWSIKEVLAHMIDSERIFGYRALRFARNDKTPLAGFEENDYAPRANADGRTLVQLGSELKNLRVSTQDLFNSFTDAMMERKGVANGIELSVKNIGFIIGGHMLHHRQVLMERYLSDL